MPLQRSRPKASRRKSQRKSPQKPRVSVKPLLKSLHFSRTADGWTASPLETLELVGAQGSRVSVCDAEGREYLNAPATPEMTFTVGGALGTHMVRVFDAKGTVLRKTAFETSAATAIHDTRGDYRDLLAICDKTMRCYNPAGAIPFEWNGKTYYWFVHWILDHCHTAKGMQFLSPHTRGLVDMMKKVQREDGMIWSNVNRDHGPGHFDTAYGPDGYAVRRDGLLLVRQPVENHCEYNYVETIYMAWKGSGDDRWMKSCLDSAMRALDYTINDRARFSKKLGLLIRGYTIDSWDFQVQDEYAVDLGQGNAMRIDPERTKMGAFMGDNTGYAFACQCLAEMLECAGRGKEAQTYRRRRADILSRLAELMWNGRFYQHRLEEDPAVVRNLEVDEKRQIVMSNAYSLNRSISHEQCVAILETYLALKAHLPNRSPGEWYAIYPPFGRGFGGHGSRWQYMNGGVHGHAAGELARGAFEHGYEKYGAGILARMLELGRKHGGTVKFAYTGAYEPPPPPQQFTPVDISTLANMDLWDQGAEGVPHWMMEEDSGNDMRNVPVGDVVLEGVPYRIADPAANGRRAAIGVSLRERFAPQAVVPVNQTAGAVYLLHTCGAMGPSNIAAAMTLNYADGTTHTKYVVQGRHLSGWWFPGVKGMDAGVAWRGPNPRSNDVGLCWAALPNPNPDKQIASIGFSASAEGAKYAVVALTLADRMPYHEPDPVSFGGPDNWSGGCVALALVEGLAGVKNVATALRGVRLSPRWAAAGVNDVDVAIHLPASNGYVAYRYHHDPKARRVDMTVTGSGDCGVLRVLLPPKARRVASASIGGRRTHAVVETVEKSRYAVVQLGQLCAPATVKLTYA